MKREVLLVASMVLVGSSGCGGERDDGTALKDTEPMTVSKPLTAAEIGVAQLRIFQFPANTLSPQFMHGSCVYRIQYGNYGSVPYAQVRYYSGDCGGTHPTVGVVDMVGREVRHYWDNGALSGGGDSCGSYFELQATSGRDPAIGVGMLLNFPDENLLFLYDYGEAVRPSRYC